MTLRTGARWLASLALASLTGTSAALAQTASAPAADAPSPGPAFGTASLSSVTLGPYAFSPVRNDVQWDTSFIDNNVFVFHTGISSLRETTFEVPNGALIEQVGIRFCDSSDTAQFTSTLRIEDSSGGPAGFIPLVASTMAETPGCVCRTATLAPSIQVDNAAKVYSLELILDTTAANRNVADPRNWSGDGRRSIANMFSDLGYAVALTDEQFQSEMAKRRQNMKTKNDYDIGCPLCWAPPAPTAPANSGQGGNQ